MPIRIMALCLAMLAAMAPAQAEPAKLKVAIVSRTIFFLPLWIADARGFLGARDIAVETQVFDNSDKINQALRDGTFQIAITSPETIIVEGYEGGPLRLVAGNAKRLPHFIIAKSSIKSLADLKGAHIGVLSMTDGTTYLLGDIAKAAGLNVRDFNVEAVGGAPTRWRLLKDHKIDAGLQPFPLSYEAEDAGFTNLGPVAQFIPEYQFTAIMVEDSWAKAHRKTVSAFLAALRQATDDVVAHPDEAAVVAAKELNSTVPLTRRALDDTEKLGILSKDLSLPEASLHRVFVALQDAGTIPRDRAYDPVKFVDESYLKESR